MNYKAIIWDFGGVITSSPFEAFNEMIEYFKDKNEFHQLQFSNAILLYNNYTFSKLPRKQIKNCKEHFFQNKERLMM